MLQAQVSMKHWMLGLSSSAPYTPRVSPAAQRLGVGKGQAEDTTFPEKVTDGH